MDRSEGELDVCWKTLDRKSKNIVRHIRKPCTSDQLQSARSYTQAKRDKILVFGQQRIPYVTQSVWTAFLRLPIEKKKILVYVQCSSLTWIKLTSNKARTTWLFSRFRRSRDRINWEKIKREQMIEGIIRVNKIPKMIERINGVSSSIFFDSFGMNSANVQLKFLFIIRDR
jgi:hypothetical protein